MVIERARQNSEAKGNEMTDDEMTDDETCPYCGAPMIAEEDVIDPERSAAYDAELLAEAEARLLLIEDDDALRNDCTALLSILIDALGADSDAYHETVGNCAEQAVTDTLDHPERFLDAYRDRLSL